MIELNDITVAYKDDVILNHFKLSIEEGSVLCIAGKSGIGKTTLLRVIMGLTHITEGKIDGLENKRMSAVFQENRLCENLSAIKNIMMVLNSSPKEAKKSAIEHLSYILPEVDLDKKVCEYSGGMKRRVAIVRAMLSPSDIVLMDEPFNGLDEKTIDVVIQYIRVQQEERTMIIVTHNKYAIEKLRADRVIKL